jgi:hypothetical protein
LSAVCQSELLSTDIRGHSLAGGFYDETYGPLLERERSNGVAEAAGALCRNRTDPGLNTFRLRHRPMVTRTARLSHASDFRLLCPDTRGRESSRNRRADDSGIGDRSKVKTDLPPRNASLTRDQAPCSLVLTADTKRSSVVIRHHAARNCSGSARGNLDLPFSDATDRGHVARLGTRPAGEVRPTHTIGPSAAGGRTARVGTHLHAIGRVMKLT